MDWMDGGRKTEERENYDGEDDVQPESAGNSREYGTYHGFTEFTLRYTYGRDDEWKRYMKRGRVHGYGWLDVCV